MKTLDAVESIFFAALEKGTPEARAAFLDQACAGDANLRRCVERLLNAHPKADGFMQAPAPGLPATTEHPPLVEKPGTLIGPYKLLQQLGEGGFGVVFLAEQEYPVRRKVALKIIKPGMDSKQVVARFEAERQALALRDHPNIARVLDGGTTESGRPFFVMELVKGISITEFCDQNRLTPRERLELFVSVCNAVQHAHQKGIIHRDLKPANVLVTMYDDKPVPKVIDFGVAKATEQKLTEKTLFTRVGQVVGTLEYMSPEQASLNALDVDTRSDVYALGVLLYELLTGSTPLDKEKLRAAGFGEMLRLIREEEPPRPSVRLSGSGMGLPLLAAYRKMESQKLPKLVRGELDWIAMKALEKDRSRRYGTATALAADVRRYLNDEQVEACPPSLPYRLGKFARKNRATFTLAGTAAALLLLGMVVSGWQAVRAMRAERHALAERDEAEDAREAAAVARKKAERETAVAKAAREEVRHSRYGLAMTLVQAAWNSDNIRRVVELLEQQRPKPGEKDLRGFEWHYWDNQLHQDRRSVLLGNKGPFVVMSGDGSRAVFWRSVAAKKDPVLEVIEMATGKVLFSRPMKAGVIGIGPALSISRDGRRVVCQITDPSRKEAPNMVVVWDVDRDKQVFAHNGRFERQFRLDSAGKHLATIEDTDPPPARKDGPGGMFAPLLRVVVVKVWNLDTPEMPTLTERIETRMFRLLAFSPDSSRVAVASGTSTRETLLRVWNLKEKRLVQNRVSSTLSDIAFSPDGTRLAGIGWTRLPGTGMGYLWDCTTADKLKELRETPLPFGADQVFPTYRLAYSPDGRQLAVWMIRAPVVRLLNAATGAEMQAIKSASVLLVAAFAKNGKRLCTLGDRSRVIGDLTSSRGDLIWQEWDIKIAEPAKTFPSPQEPREAVVRSSDGERQAVFTLQGRNEDEPATISIRNRAGKQIHLFRGHTGRINQVRFSPDGRLVYSFAGSRDHRIWKADTGKVIWSYLAPVQVRGIGGSESRFGVFSRDYGLMVRPGAKGWTVVRFDEDLRELFSVGRLTDARFSPDARRLVTVHRKDGKERRGGWNSNVEGECKLWNVESGRLIRTFPISSAITFSPDGRTFLAIGPVKPELTVRDTETGKKRVTLKGPLGSGSFRKWMFSPDGKRLITRGAQLGELVEPIVWNLTTGKELFRLEGKVRSGTSCVFSPDGKRIASSAFQGRGTSRKGTIKLWDAANGRELLSLDANLTGAGGMGTSLKFSDDGHKLILRSWTGSLVIDATPRRERK